MEIKEEILRGYREFRRMIENDIPESSCSQDYWAFVNSKDRWIKDGTYVAMITMLRQLMLKDEVKDYIKSLFDGATVVPNECSAEATLPSRDAGNPARFMITNNVSYACKWFGTRVMNSCTKRRMFKKPGYVSGKAIEPDSRFEEEDNPFYRNNCIFVDFRSFSAGDSTRALEYRIDCVISAFVEAHGNDEDDATLLIMVGDNRVWDENLKKKVARDIHALSVYNVLDSSYTGDLALYPRYVSDTSKPEATVKPIVSVGSPVSPMRAAGLSKF